MGHYFDKSASMFSCTGARSARRNRQDPAALRSYLRASTESEMSDEPKADGNVPKFTVDTHLFRELGELLVGRESTALIELVKNAYDADATKVVVYGHRLADAKRGEIKISDDGVGMDPATFERGFLRVASRLKSSGTRKSERWKRRFTGAKGIGRLAAHKLARRLSVNSIPFRASIDQSVVAVDGAIDWDRVEEAETLDKIAPGAVTIANRVARSSEKHGTVLSLSRLRGKWTAAQLGKFLVEVEALRPPKVLTQSLEDIVAKDELLFDTPTVVDRNSLDPGFIVELSGDFETGDGYWPVLVNAAHWIVEIEATPKRIRYRITPTKRARADNEFVQQRKFAQPHPQPEQGPFFHARILIRQGQAMGRKEERAWSSRSAGVRVYMEGFRVLPYGEETDDWLALARDNNERTRKLRFIDPSADADMPEQTDEGLYLLPNKHYVGAVFLTNDRAPSMQMLVNREGFIPNESFDLMTTLVRRGIDLATRVRTAAAIALAEAEAERQRSEPQTRQDPTLTGPKPAKPPVRKTIRQRTEESLELLAAKATELDQLAADSPADVGRKLRAAAEGIRHASSVSREAIPANSMVLVLASVGTQLAAFVHEVNRLLSLSSDVESSIIRLQELQLGSKARSQLAVVLGVTSDLRRALERQASYLVDVLTPDSRRRRSRQKLSEVLDATWRLVASTAERRGIQIINEVSLEHRTTKMFKAELIAILTNLLTNAVKAAGEDGKIRGSSFLEGALLIFRLENTGKEVNVDKSERWFRPFESTTLEVDPVLGQGMGLGLGITRDILGEMGATVSFVKPRRGFATAVEVRWPAEGR
jgi:signal transduction histidine kinase